MARPTKYNSEIADRICERLSTTDRGLEDICSDDDMPCAATVWNWLNRYPEFLEKYVTARGFQTELGYDGMRKIADAPLPVMDVYNPLTGEYMGQKIDAGVSMAEIQRRKLQIDIIKFKLVKLQPKRFGERKDIDVTVKTQQVLTDQQFAQLLEVAKAPVAIEGPEYEDAQVVTDEVSGDDVSEDLEDLEDLEDEDDYLG